MSRVVIDPITRIEGHLKIDAVVEEGVVKEARCSGLLFRGLEQILAGRDPLDAQRITQRVCGVCPAAHATAAALALDEACQVAEQVPDNGRLLRNLILGSNYLQSHILHFYHLAALDYVDVAAVAGYAGPDRTLRRVAEFVGRGNLVPFFPRYEGDYRLSPELNREATAHYVEALQRRQEAQEMLSIFGGKMPHSVGIFVGGALEEVTVVEIARFRWRLERIREFIDQIYLPDVLRVAEAYPDYFEMGGGCRRFLSYGVFDLDAEPDPSQRRRLLPNGRFDASTGRSESFDPRRIREQVKHSWYGSPGNLPPPRAQTECDLHVDGAYSFVKAPRYDGEVHEVGPLARILVAYGQGHPEVRRRVDDLLARLGAEVPALFSVLGRHAARALEAKLVADAMAEWVLELEPGGESCARFELPEAGSGMGLTEAPRGSLGHWVEIENHVVGNYQIIPPTTWNCSPRDDDGQPGACEQALAGATVEDESNPFELVRIVRSFDPCLACAIHLVTPKGRPIGEVQIT